MQVENIFEYEGIYHISDDAAIFPLGEGWEVALKSLANYPYETKLYKVEIVGAIMCFLTNKKEAKKNVVNFDQNLLYTAVFIDDLIELCELGYIEGAEPVTEFGFKLDQYHELIDSGLSVLENGDLLFCTKSEDGSLEKHTLKKPRLEDYVCDYLGEDWEEDYRDEMIRDYESGNKGFIRIEESIRITESGYEKLLELSSNWKAPHELEVLARPLIEIKYFDTVIRDVAALIETKLKSFHGVNKFGYDLINHHIKKCIEYNSGKLNAGIKVYQQELRTLNKFVRNDFMHNKFSIDEKNFNFIFQRQCDVFNYMNRVFERISNKSV